MLDNIKNRKLEAGMVVAAAIITAASALEVSEEYPVKILIGGIFTLISVAILKQ